MIVTTFHIPVLGNDGQPFDAEVLGWFFDQLHTRFTGYTLIGTVQGFWVGQEGRIYREEMQRYTIAVDDPETVRKLLRECLRRFAQEAMYLEVGGAAEFIE